MCEMSCVRSTVSAADDGGRRTPAGGMQARKQKPHSDVGKKLCRFWAPKYFVAGFAHFFAGFAFCGRCALVCLLVGIGI